MRRKWEQGKYILAGRLTDKCSNFCGLTDRLPNRSENVFGIQNFRHPVDTTSNEHAGHVENIFLQRAPEGLGEEL